MEINRLLTCRIPVDDVASQNDLVEDDWRAVELFHILGRDIKQQLYELSPFIRAYEPDDRGSVLKIIYDTKWTSRLFTDNTVPRDSAMSHKYATFEAGVDGGYPIYVYDEQGVIRGFVQIHDTSVELIASTEPGVGTKLLDMACWLAMSKQMPYITAGTSNDNKKINFYYKSGFEIWESYVTFHKWKDGVKPSLPSCKPVSVLKGSRRKPSAKSPVSH